MMSKVTIPREKLKRYQHKDKVDRDCNIALQNFTGLSAGLDKYRYPNGCDVQLLSLSGTVPVTFKGSVYHIPVCIWIGEKYPDSCPMVYVKPTPTMVIKEGKHVDKNGRVYLPYLHEWRHPTSDLYGLLQVLCVVFGEEPPVFARDNSRPTYGGYPRPQQGNLSYGSYGGSMPGASMPQTGQRMQMPAPYSRPPLSAYPTSTANAGMPTPYPASVGQTYNSYQGSAQPPYPSGSSGVLPPYPGGGQPSQPPYSRGPPTSMPQYPSGPGYGNPVTSSYSTGTPGYPPRTAPSSTVSTPYPASNQRTPARQDSISEEAIKASLLSAVEDKLTRRVKEVFELAKSEIEVMTVTKSELQQGAQKLAEIQQKIKDETVTIENSNLILEQKNQEMRDLIAKLESDTENLNIDEAIVTTAPLYNQIFELFAEENAVEDAIYFLGEALRREVIELDVFLKAVRKLSRKMFMLRAHLQKARQSANLQ